MISTIRLMSSYYKNTMTSGKYCNYLIYTFNVVFYVSSTRYETTTSQFLTTTPLEAASQTYKSNLSQTCKRETDRRYLAEKRDELLLEVVEMECKLGINTRWMPAMPEYQDALRYSTTRKYHQALDKLQKLVVQRLFELQKLNLSSSGAVFDFFFCYCNEILSI